MQGMLPPGRGLDGKPRSGPGDAGPGRAGQKRAGDDVEEEVVPGRHHAHSRRECASQAPALNQSSGNTATDGGGGIYTAAGDNSPVIDDTCVVAIGLMTARQGESHQGLGAKARAACSGGHSCPARCYVNAREVGLPAIQPTLWNIGPIITGPVFHQVG